jgi:hypothetical protein
MLDKYFKNKWTLEWRSDVPLLKRLLIISVPVAQLLHKDRRNRIFRYARQKEISRKIVHRF